jgi:hypothetical protein
MIDNLDRVARLLDDDIASNDPTSPLIVSLKSRRKNLRDTIVILEKRLADIRGS